MEIYVEIDGIKVKVLDKCNFDEYFKKIAKIIHRIKEEQIFFFNGVQFAFRLDGIKSQYGKIFVQFHVTTFAYMAKELIGAHIFEAELLLSKIKMCCYYTKIKLESIEDKNIKVSLLGEIFL